MRRNDMSGENDSAEQHKPEKRTGFRALLTRGRTLIKLALLLFLFVVLAFGLIRLLSPSEKFEPFELPYVEDFTDVDLKRWYSLTGVWTIRQEALNQLTNLDEYADIFIPKTVPDALPYHLSTYISLSTKTRVAGINFNAQLPDLTEKTHRVYLERVPAEEENESEDDIFNLVAGYVDDDATFVPQITVPLTSPADDYRLDLFVDETTYEVQLNGQTLIQKRPLFYPNGLLGFHSLGPVVFDTVKLTVADEEHPESLVYTSDFEQENGAAGWVPFAGDWELIDGELVQIDGDERQAGIGYEGNAFDNFVVQTTLHHIDGSGGGLLFGLPSPYQVNGGHLVRFSDQTDSIFWGYFDEAGNFERQGYADIDAVGTQPHQLRVYSDESIGSYDIFLDDTLLARGVPLQRPNGHIGLLTAASRVAYSQVEVFPLFAGKAEALPTTVAPTPNVDTSAEVAATVETPRVETPVVQTPVAQMPVADNGAQSRVVVTNAPRSSAVVVSGRVAPMTATFEGDIETAGWTPINGDWSFVDGALLQQDVDNADRAIAYVPRAFRNYSYETVLAHQEGSGGGVLFNMPYTDRLNGAHMVRYSDRTPGGIFWGYFDDNGVFVGQGHANVYIPFNQPHRMRIVSDEVSYDVYLDRVLLVSDVPLQQTSGHIGLITSKSAVAFDDLWVGAPSATAASETSTVRATGEDSVVSGQWEVEDGVYRQLAPDATDHVLNAGIYAGEYVAEADIVLPDLPDAGGGFVLHMPEQEDKAGGFIVRLIRGGNGIFWGSYDEAGLFRGRGSAQLTSKPEGTYRLRIDVDGDRIDIFVDDELIAQDVLMPRAEGWIGLAAYTGPVTFRAVNIDVDLRTPAEESSQ